MTAKSAGVLRRGRWLPFGCVVVDRDDLVKAAAASVAAVPGDPNDGDVVRDRERYVLGYVAGMLGLSYADLLRMLRGGVAP